jgi:hypothetical protein
VPRRRKERIAIVETQATAEGAGSWVEVEKGKELKCHLIAGEDQPASVAVLLHESEAIVERRRRREVSRWKVRCCAADHDETATVVRRSRDTGTGREVTRRANPAGHAGLLPRRRRD